jgi:hypothetical protein
MVCGVFAAGTVVALPGSHLRGGSSAAVYQIVSDIPWCLVDFLVGLPGHHGYHAGPRHRIADRDGLFLVFSILRYRPLSQAAGAEPICRLNGKADPDRLGFDAAPWL